MLELLVLKILHQRNNLHVKWTSGARFVISSLMRNGRPKKGADEGAEPMATLKLIIHSWLVFASNGLVRFSIVVTTMGKDVRWPFPIASSLALSPQCICTEDRKGRPARVDEWVIWMDEWMNEVASPLPCLSDVHAFMQPFRIVRFVGRSFGQVLPSAAGPLLCTPSIELHRGEA